MLRPVGNYFLFAFINDTAGGTFIPRNRGKIILTNQGLDKQGDYARWAKVLAVGPRVKEFKAGSIVLIDKLQWTKGFTYDGVEVWKSDEEKVIAIGSDESIAYDF